MSYCIDFKPFYEERDKKIKPPLFQGSLVKFGKDTFNVDRWNNGDLYCFVLVDTATVNPWKPFAKKPSEIRQMLLSGKLVIEKLYVDKPVTVS